MSAERLREAARVLRERAEAATPGPWSFENSPNGFPPMVLSHESTSVVADTYDKPHLPDATYIATVSPVFGLAVAEWLDHYASVLLRNYPLAFDNDALKVADAVLGGES